MMKFPIYWKEHVQNHQQVSAWQFLIVPRINTAWWFFATPLKNMSSSIGMMRFPTEWENKNHGNQTTNQNRFLKNIRDPHDAALFVSPGGSSDWTEMEEAVLLWRATPSFPKKTLPSRRMLYEAAFIPQSWPLSCALHEIEQDIWMNPGEGFGLWATYDKWTQRKIDSGFQSGITQVFFRGLTVWHATTRPWKWMISYHDFRQSNLNRQVEMHVSLGPPKSP